MARIKKKKAPGKTLVWLNGAADALADMESASGMTRTEITEMAIMSLARNKSWREFCSARRSLAAAQKALGA